MRKDTESTSATENSHIRKTVRFEVFGGPFTGEMRVFQKVADFASELGPDRVISISQSRDGLVTVWYWE